MNFWERNDFAFHDKEAIFDSKIRLTWEHAKRQKDCIAFGLIEMGIKWDEVTVTQLPNCVEFYLLHLAFE